MISTSVSTTYSFYTSDRKRRQHETLANEIFGRNRQGSESSRGGSRKSSTQTASLASRIGIAKVQHSHILGPHNNAEDCNEFGDVA